MACPGERTPGLIAALQAHLGLAGQKVALQAQCPRNESLCEESTDKSLLITAIIDSASRSVNAGAQRRLRDYSSVPDRRDQVVLADHTFAILDQIRQEIECLRLNDNRYRSAMQFAAIYVENMIFEQIEQFCRPATDRSLTVHPSTPLARGKT